QPRRDGKIDPRARHSMSSPDRPHFCTVARGIAPTGASSGAMISAFVHPRGIAMLDWSNLQHFLAFASTDSLPKAAEKLGVNRSTVARRIADLEKTFGTALFERRGRNLVLTQSGREVLAVAEGIDGALQGLGRRVYGRDGKIEGTIRVTLTSGVAKLIAADLAAFMAHHPGVVVDMNVTNAAEDLDLMEADVAIRLTESPPESLVGRKLVDLNSALYAAVGARIDRNGEVPYIGTVGDRVVTPWIRR